METQNGNDQIAALPDAQGLGAASQTGRLHPVATGVEIDLRAATRSASQQLPGETKTARVNHEHFIGLYQIFWTKVMHDDAHANSRAERGMIFQGLLLTAYTFLPMSNLGSKADLMWCIPRIGLGACAYTTIGILISIKATYELGSRCRVVLDAWKKWQIDNSDVQLPIPSWGTGGDRRGWHTVGAIFGPWASVAFAGIWGLILWYGS